MTVNIIATDNRPKIIEEIACRLMIGAFLFLSWKLTQIILQSISDGDVKLVLLTLSEIPVMVVMVLLFGKRNVTQDVIELNFYALLIHIIAIPIYMAGIESTYHNNAIIVLWGMTIIRLLYVGPQTAGADDFKGMPIFGILGHVRQWLDETPHSSENFLYQYSAHFLFFGSAFPLWFIVIRSNDSFVTSTIVTLMIFVFFIANHWHKRNAAMQLEVEALRADAEALRRKVEILSRAQSESQSQPQPQSQSQSISKSESVPENVRDVANQLVSSYKNTHPNMKNLNLTMAKYVERIFPDDSMFNRTSISARRIQAGTELTELILIAKDQLRCNEAANNTYFDLSLLTGKFDASLKFELDEIGMIAFMDYVMGLPPLEVPDTTFLLACDVLTTAWMRCLFSSDIEMFKAEYSSIDLLTQEFVDRFIPAQRCVK